MTDKKENFENEEHIHDFEDEVELIYLSFEDEEEEVACEVLGVFEVEDKEYIALLPEDDDGILLYEFIEEGEDFDLIPIKDEEELNLAFEAYLALFEEDFDDIEDWEESEED